MSSPPFSLVSCQIFRKPYFWSLFLSNMVGLGSGVYLVTAFGPIWNAFVGDQSQPLSLSTIILLFSLMNAGANVASSVLAGFLSSRGYMRLNVFVAWCLLLQAAVFAVMAFLDIHQGSDTKSHGIRFLYAFLIAFGGVGYGVYLTMYPMALGDAYGHANFGSFLSFMQFGAAAFSLLLPPLATAITSAANEKWFPSHFMMSGILVLGFVAMIFPKPPSDSYQTVPPPPGGLCASIFPCLRKKPEDSELTATLMEDTDSEDEDEDSRDHSNGVIANNPSNPSVHSNASDDPNPFTPHAV